MSEAIKESFMITDDQKAEWAIQQIREAREDRDRWIAYYEGQIEKVKAACDEHTANLEHRLSEYFRDVPHKKTKKQESYDLPGGKLIFKKQDPEYIRDEKLLIPWLEQNMPDYVKVKKSANWDGLKDVVTVYDGGVVDSEGELIPGVTVVERP